MVKENRCRQFVPFVLVTNFVLSSMHIISYPFSGVDVTVINATGVCVDSFEIGDDGDGSFIYSSTGFGVFCTCFCMRGNSYCKYLVYPRDRNGGPHHTRRFCLFWILARGVSRWLKCRVAPLSIREVAILVLQNLSSSFWGHLPYLPRPSSFWFCAFFHTFRILVFVHPQSFSLRFFNFSFIIPVFL